MSFIKIVLRIHDIITKFLFLSGKKIMCFSSSWDALLIKIVYINSYPKTPIRKHCHLKLCLRICLRNGRQSVFPSNCFHKRGKSTLLMSLKISDLKELWKSILSFYRICNKGIEKLSGDPIVIIRIYINMFIIWF